MWVPSASYPVLCSGSRFGAFPAPCGTASFCFLGTSQNKFESHGKERRSNFFRAPPRKHSLALGSRAHSLASPSVTRAGYGKFNNGDHHHVPEQSHSSSASLAAMPKFAPTTTRSLTTLSLATKSSYKDKDGKYIEHTEWHNLVVFGKLGRVRSHAEEGRSHPGRRRAAAAASTQHEDRHEVDHLGDSGELDPQAGSRREGGSEER